MLLTTTSIGRSDLLVDKKQNIKGFCQTYKIINIFEELKVNLIKYQGNFPYSLFLSSCFYVHCCKVYLLMKQIVRLLIYHRIKVQFLNNPIKILYLQEKKNFILNCENSLNTLLQYIDIQNINIFWNQITSVGHSVSIQLTAWSKQYAKLV